jgi:hypothetical protein
MRKVLVATCVTGALLGAASPAALAEGPPEDPGAPVLNYGLCISYSARTVGPPTDLTGDYKPEVFLPYPPGGSVVSQEQSDQLGALGPLACSQTP